MGDVSKILTYKLFCIHYAPWTSSILIVFALLYTIYLYVVGGRMVVMRGTAVVSSSSSLFGGFWYGFLFVSGFLVVVDVVMWVWVVFWLCWYLIISSCCIRICRFSDKGLGWSRKLVSTVFICRTNFIRMLSHCYDNKQFDNRQGWHGKGGAN